ncbi:glycoside hydrolase family 18 protein [Prevotella sp. KH2C16]|uniref:glycoside hydrolase family 18 protein n=1 Tax=Prevotella sp. KH2C16 TaxID=1855325 RepID=UPI0008EF2E95|nr:glycoside hydrolase family 18 protein [Prevotella sp. KH2C16]SFF85629.1 chitinase [Prevotella sp. KH2C16]
MRKAFLTLTLVLMAMGLCAQNTPKRIVVAYVAGWTTGELPNPRLMTHINYAFGHVTKTFDGMEVQNPDMLRRVVALKKDNPELKVMLSVGGWTSGNFSEMAASSKFRKSFAKSCMKAVREYGLDGIDIDWEYPTSSAAGISSSPDDTRNFTLLMRDLRKALGNDLLLTIATQAAARYIDFKGCMPYLDFVNIMAYDVADPPKHHTTLHRSKISGRMTVEDAVDAHLRAGVPAGRLCLGMPLYGRGDHANQILDKYMKTKDAAGIYHEVWDDEGQVPYLANEDGELVFGIENPRSIAAKCQLIIDRGLLGGMYWETTEDDAQQDLMQTVYLSLLKEGKATVPQRQVLFLSRAAMDSENPLVKDIKSLKNTSFSLFTGYDKGVFDRFHYVIAGQGDTASLNADARKELERYQAERRGTLIILKGN